LGVGGHFPKIPQRPCANNIIDTAFSVEDRGGVIVFFEHVNFQPRASKAQIFYFLQKDLRKPTLNQVMVFSEAGWEGGRGGGGGTTEKNLGNFILLNPDSFFLRQRASIKGIARDFFLGGWFL
jgi:hypothetical protein